MIDTGARGLALKAMNPPPVATPSAEVSASTTSVTLATAKKRRGDTVITNNGYGDLLIRLGTAPTLTTYDAIIEPGMTATVNGNLSSEIFGIWTVTGGSADILEYV